MVEEDAFGLAGYELDLDVVSVVVAVVCEGVFLSHLRVFRFTEGCDETGEAVLSVVLSCSFPLSCSSSLL